MLKVATMAATGEFTTGDFAENHQPFKGGEYVKTQSLTEHFKRKKAIELANLTGILQLQ